MKKISAVATVIVAFLFTACGEYIEIEMPDISTRWDNINNVHEVFVESNDDNTIIKDAIVNRGHCEVVRNYRIYKDDLFKVMEDEGDEFVGEVNKQYRGVYFIINKGDAQLRIWESYWNVKDGKYGFRRTEPGTWRSYYIYKSDSEIINDPKTSLDEMFPGNSYFKFDNIERIKFFKENPEYRDMLKESTFGVGKIKFANKISFYVRRCGPQIKEITLVTNGGDFTYEFY